MIHREEHIINLISDDEDIPHDVLPRHKGKGKARTPNLDDVIDISDWVWMVIRFHFIFLKKMGFSISSLDRSLLVVGWKPSDKLSANLSSKWRKKGTRVPNLHRQSEN
jgi:hypothetical protein